MASNVGISLSTVVGVEERKELEGVGRRAKAKGEQGGGRGGWEQTLKARTAAAGRLKPAGSRHTHPTRISLAFPSRSRAARAPRLAQSVSISDRHPVRFLFTKERSYSITTMADSEYTVAVEKLTYFHNAETIPSLSDVSIHLSRGSRTVLIGANGGSAHCC